MDKVSDSSPSSAFRELPINVWRKNVIVRHVDDGRHYYERRISARRASVGGAVAASMPIFNFDQNSEHEVPCRVMRVGLRVLVASAHVIDDTTLQMELREGEFYHHPLVIDLTCYCAHGLAKLPLPDFANNERRAELKLKYQKNHRLVCDLLESVEVDVGEPPNFDLESNSDKISGSLRLKAPNPDHFWAMVGQRRTELHDDSTEQESVDGTSSHGEDGASLPIRSQADFGVRTLGFLRQTLAEVTGKNAYVTKWQASLRDCDSDGGVCNCNLDRNRLHLRMRLRQTFRRLITIMRRIKACIWNNKRRLSRLIMAKVRCTQEHRSSGKKLKLAVGVAFNSQGALTTTVENSSSQRVRLLCVKSSKDDVESCVEVTARNAVAEESTMTTVADSGLHADVFHLSKERQTVFWRRVSAILNLPTGHRRKRGDLDILEQAVFESNNTCSFLEIFESLSRAVRDKILSMATQTQVPPNTIIVSKGEPIGHAYLVLAGSLESSPCAAKHDMARIDQPNCSWTDINGSFGDETLRLLIDSLNSNDTRRAFAMRIRAQQDKCDDGNAPLLWKNSVRTKAHTWLMKLPRSVTVDIIEQQFYKEKSTIKSALSKIGLIERADEARDTAPAGLLRCSQTTRFSPSYAVNCLHSLTHRRIYKANEIIHRQGTPACVQHPPPGDYCVACAMQERFKESLRQARTLLHCVWRMSDHPDHVRKKSLCWTVATGSRNCMSPRFGMPCRKPAEALREPRPRPFAKGKASSDKR